MMNDETGTPKTFLEINCSTLKSVPQFVNQVVVPHIRQRSNRVVRRIQRASQECHDDVAHRVESQCGEPYYIFFRGLCDGF